MAILLLWDLIHRMILIRRCFIRQIDRTYHMYPRLVSDCFPVSSAVAIVEVFRHIDLLHRVLSHESRPFEFPNNFLHHILLAGGENTCRQTKQRYRWRASFPQYSARTRLLSTRSMMRPTVGLIIHLQTYLHYLHLSLLLDRAELT